MKALVYRGGADPAHALEMKHIAEPVPGRKQILIDAQYSTAGMTDWIRFSDEEGRTLSLGKPLRMFRVGVGKPLGGEVSGTVRSVGEEVTGFAPGDAVYAATPRASGAWAQLCVADADDCARVPDHLGMREAACLAVGPVVALAALRAADVQEGSRVLVWGATGGVGRSCIQLARYLGADVVGSCRGTNEKEVLAAGAARAIDCDSPIPPDLAGTFEAVLGINGSLSLKEAKSLLAEGGTFVLVGGSTLGGIAKGALLGKAAFLGSGKKYRTVTFASASREHEVIRDACEKGFVAPLIDDEIPISQLPLRLREIMGRRHPGKTSVALDF